MFFTIGRIFVLIFLVWISIRTMSYGAWNWKNHSKLGGFAVILLALAALIFPAYMMLKPP